ncbi:MAG: hypothetical protein LBU69_04535 [Deltaproteobacteria bacterium]|nr:hypothetical protein [Deltaproteobacteria bacterium]
MARARARVYRDKETSASLGSLWQLAWDPNHLVELRLTGIVLLLSCFKRNDSKFSSANHRRMERL